ncbi:hypothetical protein MD484_g1676, partial [Candolleomyces efflorescens]
MTFIAVTIALGTGKAVKASDSAVSVTIEWVSGIVILLLAFFFTQYEIKDTAKPYWFFRADMMDGVRALFQRFNISIPHYDTEERSLDVLIKPKHPPVTAYRIIVTAAAIWFGTAKAMLSYRGQPTTPTTVEWAYGVVVTVILYSLGLYETSANEVLPWLFTTDYSLQITTGGLAIGFTAIHLVGLSGAGWWIYAWGSSLPASFKSGWNPNSTDRLSMTAFDLFFQRVLTLLWVVIAIFLFIGGGIFVMYLILYSWVNVAGSAFLKGIRFAWRPFGRLVGRVLSIDLDAEMDKNDDETLADFIGRWTSQLKRRIRQILDHPSTPLQWAFSIAARIVMAILYVLVHAVALILVFGWTSLWIYGLKSRWSGPMGETQDHPATAVPLSQVSIDTIELDNLVPRLPATRLPLDVVLAENSRDSSSWHPKVTAYRLTFVAVTIGLGIAKAVKASDSAVSVTIEWVSGVVILLLAFSFTQYEIKDSAKPYWFFRADMMDGVRALVRRFGITVPHYDTEERGLDVLIKPKHPPVTAYRMIVTAAAISFGMAKALLSYHGQQTTPTTVEWAYGVVVTVMCVTL